MRRLRRFRPGSLRDHRTRGNATSSGWCRSLRWSPRLRAWPGGAETWPGPVQRASSARPARRPRGARTISRATADSSAPGDSNGTTERAASAEPSTTAVVYSRNIPVSSNEDLLEIIATAPRRSVIVLSDDGPYQLGGRAWSFRARRRFPMLT